jgi:hypothetical protein
MTCRDWLRENGYEDVADLIDKAMARIAEKGTRQRRNWWDILAGDAHGQPCVREGIEFPVLRVAQIRQERPATANAIARNPNEVPPEVVRTNRWKRKRPSLPTKAQRAPRKSEHRRRRAS